MEPYLDDELVLICGQDSPLASHQTVSIHDIAEEKLLLREKNSATREMAENILTSCGLTVLPAWESSSTSALVNAVALGLGISILPRRFVQPEIDSGKVVPLELAGVEFKRTDNIIYLRDRYLSPAALDFLALVDDEESKVKLS